MLSAVSVHSAEEVSQLASSASKHLGEFLFGCAGFFSCHCFALNCKNSISSSGGSAPCKASKQVAYQSARICFFLSKVGKNGKLLSFRNIKLLKIVIIIIIITLFLKEQSDFETGREGCLGGKTRR